MLSQRFRRSESQARQDLLNAVKASPRLAEKAASSFPRGKQNPITQEWEENRLPTQDNVIFRSL
jgi:hypothetical protein